MTQTERAILITGANCRNRQGDRPSARPARRTDRCFRSSTWTSPIPTRCARQLTRSPRRCTPCCHQDLRCHRDLRRQPARARGAGGGVDHAPGVDRRRRADRQRGRAGPPSCASLAAHSADEFAPPSRRRSPRQRQTPAVPKLGLPHRPVGMRRMPISRPSCAVVVGAVRKTRM